MAAEEEEWDLSYVPFDYDLLPRGDLGPRLNATVWTFTGVAAVILILRIYCKLSRRKALWLDDHVLVAAWISLALLGSFNSAAISLGFGKHSWEIPRDTFDYLLLHCNLAGTFSILAAAWSKTSFALTLYRLTAERPFMRAFLWFAIISINLACGGVVVITWAQCTPVEKVWQPNLEPGTCWPKSIHINYNIFAAVYSGTMDIVLALVPWILIWRLTLSKKEKFGMLVAMSMGILLLANKIPISAGIVSFVKISTLYAIEHADMIKTVDLVTWGAAESAVTIIAASLPVLRVFVVTHVKSRNVNEPNSMATEEKTFLRRLDFFSTASTRSRGSSRPDSGAWRPSSRNGWRRVEVKDWRWKQQQQQQQQQQGGQQHMRSPTGEHMNMHADDVEMAYQSERKSPLQPVYENPSSEDFEFGFDSEETSREADLDGLRAHPLTAPGRADSRDFPLPPTYSPRG
ncbi:hypothetical protein SODALDRAFT_324596 [Sodiomyces alkalinus F11]|uniref:Rhodopsin domain-containing protein n=1 Tax=Sodiomyces alkalinus (strain CBS 110278 / VKM F-3762 / F11) TaxID=1314773 RepID=A0A3N2PV14_SODAK|nr:hypothetical protein SODALDRAFT_324596 [Sodiomyces alkalinus F11]ROT38186.1 hypothetical protein SODALDRAFT_324596 [Sodiomyces alkalinus F11]